MKARIPIDSKAAQRWYIYETCVNPDKITKNSLIFYEQSAILAYSYIRNPAEE